MNCVNCGAAMELVSEGGHFLCRYCGSFLLPRTTATEGAILGRPADLPGGCPLCDERLSAASLRGEAIHACPRCKGMLVSRDAFAGVVASWRAAERATEVPGRLKPFDVPRNMKCPACGGRMQTHPYYGPGNIIIDTCDACDLVWLDPGELTRVVKAPGRDKPR